uniref:Uncharacterized protein n=1 Tax=Physcomitrium patens TaxID=3218 RepID=A0A7I3ZHN8_PHYPA
MKICKHEDLLHVTKQRCILYTTTTPLLINCKPRCQKKRVRERDSLGGEPASTARSSPILPCEFTTRGASPQRGSGICRAG